MGETLFLLVFDGCIFHGTGNSAQLSEYGGGGGLNTPNHPLGTTLTGTLPEDLRTLIIVYHSVPFRMTNGLDNSCGENKNTNFMFTNVFPNVVSFMR
jgi:hypothetical protein